MCPKVGITASCFDLLHAGHVAMLREAKMHCDYLICCLQVDPSLERPEKNKPVQSIVERYIQIAGSKYVDEVIPYCTEQDLMAILTTQPIHIRFVGEEYRNRAFTGNKLHIPIFFNSRKHRFSSTELRNRLSKK